MNREYLVRELGIELLASACSLEVLRHDAMSEPLDIAPHHHDGVLQLDLIRGCRGRVFSGGRWLRFDNDVALAAYPGETHGYALGPARADAAVFNIKIRPRNTIESLSVGPIVRIGHGPDAELFRHAEELRASVDPLQPPGPRPILALLSLLMSWPARGPVRGPVRGAAPGRGGPGERVHPVVEQAVSQIESNLGEPLRLDEIASEVGVSSRQLARLFERSMGMTPHRYSTMRRLDRAKTMLLANRAGIGEIGETLGFSGHATFTRWFAQHAGMPPSEFRTNPRVF